MQRFMLSTTALIFSLTLGACDPAAGNGTINETTSSSVKSKAVTESMDYKVVDIATELSAPWALAFLPDGDMLVTEKTAGMVRVGPDGSTTRITGLPEAYIASQGGYLDLILSPDFESDQTVFMSYSSGDANDNATAIFKGVLEGDNLNGETIFTARPTKSRGAHYGARMAFLPDGTLLLTTGDGYTEKDSSQTLDNHFGKVLRINTDGSPAADNPFIDTPGALPEIFSFGHRNPQGLIYDAETSTIWSHEHGPKGGDEVNIIDAGTNYGWPLASFGIDYSGQIITPYDSLSGMEDSLYYWNPSIAPSGCAVYYGDQFPAWNGDLFVGGLASKDLRRLDIVDGKVAKETILLAARKERVRDVRIGPDGAIYALTETEKDGPGGKLIKITP